MACCVPQAVQRACSVRWTWVSDAGLPHLKALASLESLETGGTKVTAAGLAELRSALPKLKD